MINFTMWKINILWNLFHADLSSVIYGRQINRFCIKADVIRSTLVSHINILFYICICNMCINVCYLNNDRTKPAWCSFWFYFAIIFQYNPLLTYTLRYHKMYFNPNVSGRYTVDEYKGTQYYNVNITIDTTLSLDKVSENV